MYLEAAAVNDKRVRVHSLIKQVKGKHYAFPGTETKYLELFIRHWSVLL